VKQLVFITGLSGSGKSLAARCFEDLGFFCVDNLPVGLIPPFCVLIRSSGESFARSALVVDARERSFLEKFPATLAELRQKRNPVQLLFFECSDDVLKRRFSESRRPHPMAQPNGTLQQAIAAERAALEPLREMADRIIDTSHVTPHQLRGSLSSAYGPSAGRHVPSIHVVSFGFKYGVPAESDLVFDLRFLPNPYFVDGLRRLDGLSPEVQAYLERVEETGQFLERLTALLDFLIPRYGSEGKTYVTLSLGCTGGKHRSVALAERVARLLERRGWSHTVSHRDLGKE
jgi:UPF0042 nucleotide-binding protein